MRIQVKILDTSRGIYAVAATKVRLLRFLPEMKVEAQSKLFPHGQEKQAAADAKLLLIRSIASYSFLPTKAAHAIAWGKASC